MVLLGRQYKRTTIDKCRVMKYKTPPLTCINHHRHIRSQDLELSHTKEEIFMEMKEKFFHLSLLYTNRNNKQMTYKSNQRLYSRNLNNNKNSKNRRDLKVILTIHQIHLLGRKILEKKISPRRKKRKRRRFSNLKVSLHSFKM